MVVASSRGSAWRRWDPHIHTPATLLANQFDGDWDAYFSAIESEVPRVEALGITEYCVLTGYKQFISHRGHGRASNVSLVFPNIEFRFDIQTEKKKGINLHLLFSPDDTNHVEEIESALATLTFTFNGTKYKCTEADLTRLGRAVDPKQTDAAGALRKGVEQFKISRDGLRELFNDHDWVAKNCIVGIDAGESDGSAGLKKDASFFATRQELESFADVVFSPRESDRDFWLGRRADHPPSVIEERYRSLKPCLHGSDAHRVDSVLRPEKERYCWVRADATFTGLKQALLEPELRVWIGPQPPVGPNEIERISAVEVSGARWLVTPKLEFNDGLVAIIGPRGSGKTALADLVAHGAGMKVDESASFLAKAREHLTNEKVLLRWGAGLSEPQRLADVRWDDEAGHVRYLSQQFVERLCAADGMADELVVEMENVVFQSIPEDQRLGATSFTQLRSLRLEQIERQKLSLLDRVRDLTLSIAEEDEKKARLPKLTTKHKDCLDKVGKIGNELQALLPKDKKDELKRLAEIEAVADERRSQLQTLRLRLQQVAALSEEFPSVVEAWRRDISILKDSYEIIGLQDSEWRSFEPQISGAWKASLDATVRAIQEAEKLLVDGSPDGVGEPSHTKTWSLRQIEEKQKALTAEVGIEKERTRKYAEVQRQQRALKVELTNLEKEIADCKAADSRRSKAIDERRREYAGVFDLFSREQKILEELYSPLREQLQAGDPGERRLQFYVRRKVDMAAWVARGEALLDLRKTGAFKLSDAGAPLADAWRNGDSTIVGPAMESFIEAVGKTLSTGRRATTGLHDIGEWLFSTDHVSLAYGVRYDDVELSKLSPGMRGIVLLMLYLSVDLWDRRPLIVDQPEENLDPQSVYEDLVRYFRAAKHRRQVILVTHNPNLVVNTDADQVIVASSERTGPGLPKITYQSGGLENESIRKAVCRVLEGGERAFRERERRYDLPRDPRASRV